MLHHCTKKEITKHVRGFTLIELMVAVAIFSIVLMMALGTVLTIMDANRKARTLTEVMNNLNFSLESVTRSLKTGVEPELDDTVAPPILRVIAIVLEEDVAGDRFRRETIEYQLRDATDGRGFIGRRVDGGEWIPITSDQVDITRFNFTVAGTADCVPPADCHQPRTQISMEGDVRVNDKISSSFSLQTTVSQRKLNLEGSEVDTGL